MKIVTILGTRPEIIKLSPLMPLLDNNFRHLLVHTGQHYSYNLDRIFFEELGLRLPDFTLEVGSKSGVKQVAKIMLKLEPILVKEKPDSVLVQGDTNSTLGGALAAAKLQIPVIHVEAGCRSFNPLMPEEINRILTDHCSSFLFAPDQESCKNLIQEGISKQKIFLVGSTVIDASIRNREYARSSIVLDKLGFNSQDYALLTLHRAENTDDPEVLSQIIRGLNKLAEQVKLVFPIHPRTKKALKTNKIKINPLIKVIDPVGYLDFLKLLGRAQFVMTDSGGIQEEAVALGNLALILRNETEWVEYTRAGRNMIIGTTAKQIVNDVNKLLNNPEYLAKMRKTKIKRARGVDRKIIDILKKLKLIA